MKSSNTPSKNLAHVSKWHQTTTHNHEFNNTLKEPKHTYPNMTKQLITNKIILFRRKLNHFSANVFN